MRIAATGNFGTVTWEMGPEASEQYRKTIAMVKEGLGEQTANEFERAFVEQVQAIFSVAALQMQSAINAPHLALIMPPMIITSLGIAAKVAIGLLEAEKRNMGQ